MKTEQFPQVDMLLVSKNARKQREVLMGFVPDIGLSGIDLARLSEVDTFYSLCQRQRDYYRDPYGKVNSVSFFDVHPRKFASRPEPTTVYLEEPCRFVLETKPVIYPMGRENETMKKIPQPINLSGQYDLAPCYKYKR